MPFVKPAVALLFPPLVETNFGSYYPSTAVLSGYLSSLGIASVQGDLNEDFAVYLLDPERLNNMISGNFGDDLELPPESVPAVAARLISRYRDFFTDQQGKHVFREDASQLSYLLNMAAKPYRIDKPLAELTNPEFFSSAFTQFYQAFLERNIFLNTLPDDLIVAGISVPTGPQLGPALILSRYLKRHKPDVSIILGGPTISFMDKETITQILTSHPSIDALVISDGEYPLAELTFQKQSGTWQPDKVSGVASKSGDNVVLNLPAEGLDLNKLPYAEYEPGILNSLHEPEIGIVQARGCYWGKCHYCDYTGIYRGSSKYRSRNPSSFVNEMEYQIKQHGVNRFSVITEAIPPAFANRMSQLILERGLQVKWHSFAIADRHFTVDIMETMVEAGCEFLAVGIESMNDRVLKLMNKCANRQQNIDFMLNAKEAGLNLKINLIPDLPSTNFQEAMESLEVVSQLEDSFNFVSCFPFEATRSSKVGSDPSAYGLEATTVSPIAGQAQFSLNHLGVHDPAMTAEQREAVHRAYQAFAAEVNTRLPGETIHPCDVELDTSNTAFQLAIKRLDLIQIEGGIQCYNAVTRMRFNIPAEWAGIIDTMRTAGIFYYHDFASWIPAGSQAEFYFNKLLQMGVIEVAGQG